MIYYPNRFVLFTCLFEVALCVSNSLTNSTFVPSISDDIVTIIDETVVNKTLDLHEPDVHWLSKNCTPGLENFTERVTNLTRCIVVNARPIRLCVNCEENFKATMEVYKKLQEEPSPCHQFYFQSDQIGIINQVYTQGRDLWTQNSCQNCQDYINDTLEFFDVARELEDCFIIYNGTSPEVLNNTCRMCDDLFVKMNDIYKEFVQRISSDKPEGVCMDIVDKMNITRHIWSRQNCLKFDSYVGYPNIITAVLVGAMPIFFYMLSKNISIIEDVKLVRPKRKSFTPLPPESLEESGD